MKAVLGQERERERLEREKRRAAREEAMEVDGAAVAGDDMPSCGWPVAFVLTSGLAEDCGIDLSIEAPPSVLPQRRYCDITGLEVRESSQWQIMVSVGLPRHLTRIQSPGYGFTTRAFTSSSKV